MALAYNTLTQAQYDALDQADYDALVQYAVMDTPGGLLARSGLNAAVPVVWNQVTDAMGYHLLRSATQNGTYAQIANVVATAALRIGFVDVAVRNGTTYWYKVTAYDADAESDPTAAVSAIPALPAAYLSIKERVERLMAARTGRAGFGALAVGKVYRWDGRGLRDPETGSAFGADGGRLSMKHQDAMIVADEESAEEGGQGNDEDGGGGGGTTAKTLTIEIHLKLAQDETDTTSTSALHNAWLLALERAILAQGLAMNGDAGTRLEEDADDAQLPGAGGGQQLAISVRVTATSPPPVDDGQREATTAIRFEVEYEHYRNDPAAGPGITHKTDDDD